MQLRARAATILDQGGSLLFAFEFTTCLEAADLLEISHG
jgi:hypothetical protein